MKTRTIKEFNINVPEDVESFFRYILEDLECWFHPDDDFKDMIDVRTEEDMFDIQESEKLNSYMDRCFRICQTHHEDIYEIAHKMQMSLLKKQNL